MKLIHKLKLLFSRDRRECDLEDELRFHLEAEAEETDAGAARRSLGNVARIQENSREAWTFPSVESFLRDTGFALRSLRKNPGFAILAILILGLGIGSSTAMFSVVNAVSLKPLAYRDPDRIVALWTVSLKTGVRTTVSLPDFDDWKKESAAIEKMAYYSGGETSLQFDSGPQFATVFRVSPEFFDIFGLNPLLGRPFTPEEGGPGGTGAAIVSDSFWRARLGGDPAVIGKKVRLGSRALDIIGVMPPGFRYPQRADVWIPTDTIIRDRPANRGGHNFRAIGLLKPGVTLEAAQAGLTLTAARLEREYPATNFEFGAQVSSLRTDLIRDYSTMLYVLLGAVLLVLLIACGNVANLLLAKSASRTREIALRASLGAGRARLIRQMITESLTLALLAAAVGIAIAKLGSVALVALAPAGVPRLEEAGLDARVLVFLALLAGGSCLLFGLVPALRVSRVDLIESLKIGGGRATSGHSNLRRALVVTEVALSVVLLAGAGLLIRSFAALEKAALGFDTENILIMETSTIAITPEAAARTVRAYKEFLAEAAAIPGITAIGATRTPPGQISSAGSFVVDAKALAGQLAAKDPQAVYSIVAPGTFAALGIAIKSGRDFSDADGPDAPLTALINESASRVAFGDRDPIGHMVFTGMDIPKPMRIVGVVADFSQAGPGTKPQPEVYMPYEQHQRPSTGLRIIARTTASPDSVAEALRVKARALMPQTPLRFVTMQERMAANVATPRFRTILLSLFAAIAVLLSMAGVYAVISFLVGQRTQEIGLRMALGATAPSILQLIMTQGFAMAGAGLVLGIAGSLASTRLLASMLYEVEPFDPLTYAAVIAVATLVTLAACLGPALRAARLDPIEALRQE